MQDKQENNNKEKRIHFLHHFVAFFIGIGAFISIIASALILYGYQTKDTIAPFVQVAGVKIGGLTYSEAKNTLDEHFSPKLTQEISINAHEKIITTTAEEAGLNFNTQAAVDEAYAIGKQRNLWHRYFSLAQTFVKKDQIQISPQIQTEKLDQFIAKVTTDINKDPVNAEIKGENGQIVIAPGQDGIGIDAQKLSAQIKEVFYNNEQTNAIVADFEVLKPQIQETNLQEAKTQAETMSNRQFVFTFEDKNYTANKSIIVGWLNFANQEGKILPTFSDEKISAYIATLAKKIDIKAQSRELSNLDKSVLKEGRDGRALNRSLVLSAIKNELVKPSTEAPTATIALQVETIERGEKIVQQPFTPGLYPGKYIEVNLSNQRMYIWEGTNMIKEYIVSTGKWGTPTPVGTRYIQNKILRAWSSTYKLWMPYWMGIGGGYGIHELPERDNGWKEGERDLGIPASHGCIRLGINSSKEVYDWAEIGLPVYIHKN